MDAIIYTTNTGSTEQYAKLLVQKTGLPAYSIAEAKKRGFAGAESLALSRPKPKVCAMPTTRRGLNSMKPLFQ